jgi:hypothetical protein
MGFARGLLLGMLLALAWLVAFDEAAAEGKRVALVVANAGYGHANRLTNPPRDAELVSRSLARAGFASVTLLTDAGVGQMQTALRAFRQRAAGAEIALIYYAGHGIEGNGRNWLIPVDAKLESEYDLTFEAINLDQALEAVAGASLRVVVLDACRDNPFGRSWKRGTRAFSRGLTGLEADDVLVIYAAAPGQTAADGDGRNSPFAEALARRLPESDLPIQLLGGVVRDDVLAATSGRQRPFVSASITGTPFYLMPRGGAQAAATAPAPVRAPPPPPAPRPAVIAPPPTAPTPTNMTTLWASLGGAWRRVTGENACYRCEVIEPLPDGQVRITTSEPGARDQVKIGAPTLRADGAMQIGDSNSHLYTYQNGVLSRFNAQRSWSCTFVRAG